MVPIFVVLVLCIYGSGFLLLARALACRPVGYEDETGFRTGRPLAHIPDESR